MATRLLHLLVIAASLAGVNGRAQLPFTLPPEQKPVVSIALVAVQDKVKVGSPLILRATVTNISDHSVGLAQGLYAGPYSVEVRDSNDKLPPETDFGFGRNGHATIDEVVKRLGTQTLNDHGYSFELKPGEKRVDGIDVLRFYKLTEPGKFTIYAVRGGVKSNVITVTLTAP